MWSTDVGERPSGETIRCVSIPGPTVWTSHSTRSSRHRKDRGRAPRGLSWVFWRHLCFGGLTGALVLFCLSLTPSLLPHGWVLQGVVSGVAR